MNKDLEFLIKIVKEAKEISNKKFEVKQKGTDNDLVTNLDVEIEEYLIKKMKEAYPTFDIVSEEENYKKELSDNCFTIDPIDGTINFANGLPFWGIQVACIRDGKTVAAVIDLVKLNELYYADETGAYLNGEKISVREVPIKNALYDILGLDTNPCFVSMRKYSKSKRHFGSVCVSMAFLASGRIHGVAFRKDTIWDYVPGLFIAKMAGAKIKDIPSFHSCAMNQEFLDILEKETTIK
jgi:myo-inositol-1(or 4)-monophosphatase